MLKSEFFIKAMQMHLGHSLEWCLRAFAIVTEEENAWKENSYPGKIVQHHTGNYFVDDHNELVKLEDAPIGEPPFKFSETLVINPGDIPNNKETITTSYGNLLFNWYAIVYAFGDKIPYQTGRVSIDKIRSLVLKNFEDDPVNESLRKPGVIYVSDYLKFSEAIEYTKSFTQMCVWSVSPKTILPPPGIKEYREKLIEENKDTINDLATIAKIDAALVAYDKAWLKGDPAEKFLLGNKATAIVRKKKFLMHGAETGMAVNATTADLVENSLYEGWDIDKFPVMMDSLRSGSFDRGAQTALGGVSVKWLQRASANLRVVPGDCGSKIGSPILITPEESKKLVGLTIVDNGSAIKISDDETAGRYLGKVVMVRNPMYCKMPYTDYCETCLGDKLSLNKYGLSAAVSQYGSKMMLIFMAAVHGKQVATSKMDIDAVVS